MLDTGCWILDAELAREELVEWEGNSGAIGRSKPTLKFSGFFKAAESA